jgi:hypothetical protein
MQRWYAAGPSGVVMRLGWSNTGPTQPAGGSRRESVLRRQRDGSTGSVIHAGGLDSSVCDRQIASFAERYWAIRYDRPGIGQSHVVDADCAHANGRDLRDLLASLGVEARTLWGSSCGQTPQLPREVLQIGKRAPGAPSTCRQRHGGKRSWQPTRTRSVQSSVAFDLRMLVITLAFADIQVGRRDSLHRDLLLDRAGDRPAHRTQLSTHPMTARLSRFVVPYAARALAVQARRRQCALEVADTGRSRRVCHVRVHRLSSTPGRSAEPPGSTGHDVRIYDGLRRRAGVATRPVEGQRDRVALVPGESHCPDVGVAARCWNVHEVNLRSERIR